jgi:hydroxymethylbilane synthase
VGARSSPLSQAQVKEVQEALDGIHFLTEWVETTGDLDQTTSLRDLDKTDFFTKELDHMLLKGEIQAAIHSAKDLPDPLPDGIAIAALTEGVDPSDSLVLRSGETLQSLKKGALIATSSKRREEMVQQILAGCIFTDIRGTIGKRLSYLFSGQVDGVVIAEAALLRLKLCHLNRYRLPQMAAPYQGKLAILCREEDVGIKELFAPLDTRKKVLWTGLNPPRGTLEKNIVHFPLIHCEKTDAPCPDFKMATHLLFTSQTAVSLFFETERLIKQKVIAVGKKTAAAIEKQGVFVDWIAEEETSEGVISLLTTLNLNGALFFWPHSKLSRPLIKNWLNENNIPLIEWILYDTKTRPQQNPPPFDVVVFTSPSTIDGWIELFGALPDESKIETIGPVTFSRLT